MKIYTLIENTEGKKGAAYEHGLSIYVETSKHRIIIDTGATGAFIDNAKLLGIDMSMVDILMLSHGHYDHSGGILRFAKENERARIYMQMEAVKDFYHVDEKEERYIGINKDILKLKNIKLLEGNLQIDEEISVFTGIKGRRNWPKGNLVLKEKTDAGYKQDEFGHEQCMVIDTEGKKILISGCAHNGILNILDEYKGIYNDEPDIVISGFHMKKNAPYDTEEIENIKETAKELMNWKKTIFYSGHCTGTDAFAIMKEIMKNKLVAIKSCTRLL